MRESGIALNHEELHKIVESSDVWSVWQTEGLICVYFNTPGLLVITSEGAFDRWREDGKYVRNDVLSKLLGLG